MTKPRPVNPVYEEYPQPPSAVFEAWQQTHDLEAGTSIVQNYDRFLTEAVAQYSETLRESGGTIDEDDLVQEGRQAVLHHAALFDTTSGRRFLPSAAEDILGAIALVQLQHGSAVYLHSEPPKIRDYCARNGELAEAGEPPMIDREAARFLGIEATGHHAVAPCPTAPWTVPGLRTTLEISTAQSFEKLAEDAPTEYQEARIIGTAAPYNIEDQTALKMLVRDLLDIAFRPGEKKDRQKNLALWREVMEWRHGLKGGRPHTQEEVATALDLSRTHVNQIERAALLRMKAYAQMPRFEGIRYRRVYIFGQPFYAK